MVHYPSDSLASCLITKQFTETATGQNGVTLNGSLRCKWAIEIESSTAVFATLDKLYSENACGQLVALSLVTNKTPTRRDVFCL